MADEIDFEIFGDDTQYIEITLDPGEAAIAEAGALMYMEQGVEMQTIFGDGSGQDSGLFGKLFGAGKRMLTGESLFTTAYINEGGGRKNVAFAAPYPGKIIPMDLRALGGQVLCQRDAFLCAAKGVSIGVAFQKRIMTGLFGGEGFIMQRLEGDGLAFVHAGGSIARKELGAGETIYIDTGCVVALQPEVDFSVESVKGIKSTIFGGEGMFLAKVTGPGVVWMQSMPISHMAGQILSRAGDSGESGAVGGLEGIGNLFERR